MRKKVAAFLKVFFFLAIILFIPCRGCVSNPEEAVEAVEIMGFTEAEVLHHGWFLPAFRGCGADAAIIRVGGINPAGEAVKLNVCLGWPFKGATIRGK